MGIGLSIVFSGLCALVTDGATGSGHVVLVDTRSLGTVGGVPLPAHAPTLVLGLGSLVNPELSGPDRVVADWPGSGGSVGQVGFWDLTGSEVRIRVQRSEGGGLRVFTQADGQSSWPEPPRDSNDPSSWRDIRYVADMASITGDGRIRPELLANAGGRLPRGIAARIHLDDGLIESGVPSREEFRDEVFEFASNGRRAGIASRPTAGSGCWWWTRSGCVPPDERARANSTRASGCRTRSTRPAGADSSTGSTSTGSEGHRASG